MADLLSSGISLIPSVFKAVQGFGQKARARRINPIDPGYTMNAGVIDNARVLGERAGNYQIPGYTQARNNILSGYGQAFSQGVEGASSSGDVLDLATRLSYGQGNKLNQLAIQNAQGAEEAQLRSLQANAAAGNEYQAKNAYEREKYQQQLREKAALLQGGNENIYGALTEGATVATDFLNPKKKGDGEDPSAMLAKLLMGGL